MIDYMKLRIEARQIAAQGGPGPAFAARWDNLYRLPGLGPIRDIHDWARENTSDNDN